jgi:hypothetical protein
MLPHLKTWSLQEKEASRKAFDEGSRQRGIAMQNQRRISSEEMMAIFSQTKVAANVGLANANACSNGRQ